MHKWIAALLIISFFALQGAAVSDESPLNYSIKELHAAPTEDSGIIYEIPVDVVLLDISEDANWHKVKISFSIGPFSYTYVGWAKIPVGQTIVDREKQTSEIANLPEIE
jgi:hypothetical protein